ncbi:hypothetical protein C8F04DRAFT_1037146 [Mycena alexandri]|uniref:Uncharacterized protein n=1 Tax=Mycena alexandri TaxID=1745969 RepID=A0AAD6X805_9AGAR|nr:hypothetical protein C8F04DRAFT_1037146 [Mycena alexandri]
MSDNLRPDVKYISSWPSNGLTNQVIIYMNLIYLGLITDRVPIIPRFIPIDMPPNSPELDFGEVFDIPRFQEAVGLPIIHWPQVKVPNSDVVDDVGCWNVQNVMWHTSGLFHGPPASLKLDISYTTPPDWVEYPAELNDPQFPHMLIWPLASLAFSETRSWTPKEPETSRDHKVALPPDEQLFCIDMLYYVGAHEVFEITKDISPVWRFVGQYMHWHPKIELLAAMYTRDAFDIPPGAPIPPYIAVHARRTDFKMWCNGIPESECYVELSAMVKRVEEVKGEILGRKGINVTHVIMTSDEPDAAWWDAVRKLGWYWPDHSKARTEAIYGPWYSTLIDGAIQSGGLGFVGTDRSTYSTLSGRRVRSWADGATRMVRWGKPGM